MSEIFGMVELETIEKLSDIVSKKELSEITLADGERTITIKGKKFNAPAPVPFMGVPSAQVAAPVQTAEAAEEKEPISGNVIKSPIVGTFYAAPSPEKPPFVKVGDTVKKGDVIMIIESMKLMNEIKSDFDGVVKEILVSNGQAVEYDQPIMVIE